MKRHPLRLLVPVVLAALFAAIALLAALVLYARLLGR